MKKFIIIGVIVAAVAGFVAFDRFGPGSKVDDWRPYYAKAAAVQSGNPILRLMPQDAAQAIRNVSRKNIPRAGVRESFWQNESYTKITICPEGGGGLFTDGRSTCSVVTVFGTPEEVSNNLELIKSHQNWVALLNRCPTPSSATSNISCAGQGWVAIGEEFNVDLVTPAHKMLANANDGQGIACADLLLCQSMEAYLGPLPAKSD